MTSVRCQNKIICSLPSENVAMKIERDMVECMTKCVRAIHHVLQYTIIEGNLSGTKQINMTTHCWMYYII